MKLPWPRAYAHRFNCLRRCAAIYNRVINAPVVDAGPWKHEAEALL